MQNEQPDRGLFPIDVFSIDERTAREGKVFKLLDQGLMTLDTVADQLGIT